MRHGENMVEGILKKTFLKRSFSRLANRALLLILFAFLLSSCASRYFNPLPTPKEPVRIKDLGELPYRELWQGFVFNGEKVGFTHLKIVPMPEGQSYQILSEARMHIRFMGMDKKITMNSDDIVRPDLTLVSFHNEQKMDEKPPHPQWKNHGWQTYGVSEEWQGGKNCRDNSFKIALPHKHNESLSRSPRHGGRLHL